MLGDEGDRPQGRGGSSSRMEFDRFGLHMDYGLNVGWVCFHLYGVLLGVLGVLGDPGVLGVLFGDLHLLLRPARCGAVAKQQRVLEEIYICLRANHIFVCYFIK